MSERQLTITEIPERIEGETNYPRRLAESAHAAALEGVGESPGIDALEVAAKALILLTVTARYALGGKIPVDLALVLLADIRVDLCKVCGLRKQVHWASSSEGQHWYLCCQDCDVGKSIPCDARVSEARVFEGGT